MKLQGIDWTLSVESESWGLEVSAELKKHGRAHFATLLSAGQSSSSSELVSGAWAALNIQKCAGLWKLNLLCRNNEALFHYQINIPNNPKHLDDEVHVEPVWSLPLSESVFSDSSDSQAQAGTGLAMLLTNTSLGNLKRQSDGQGDDNPWKASARSLGAMQ